MAIHRTRRQIGALLGFLTLIAATICAPQAAMASTSDSLSAEQISELSDQEFIDYAMNEGKYELSTDGTITIEDTRAQYTAANTRAQVSPSCIACAEGRWKISSKSGPTTTYGSWTTEASGKGPGTLSQTVSKTVSNSYSGTLSVTKSALSTAVGFNVTSSKTVSNTYSGELKSGKTGKLQVRPVYGRYAVKQEYVKLGKVTKTSWVYPKKFTHLDYRITY